MFQYQRFTLGALNGCHSLTGHSSITLHLSHADNILQGKNKMTTVMPAVVYFHWDKMIIFLLSIDRIDFPFSAQDKFSDIIFPDWSTLNLLAAPGDIQQVLSRQASEPSLLMTSASEKSGICLVHRTEQQPCTGRSLLTLSQIQPNRVNAGKLMKPLWIKKSIFSLAKTCSKWDSKEASLKGSIFCQTMQKSFEVQAKIDMKVLFMYFKVSPV